MGSMLPHATSVPTTGVAKGVRGFMSRAHGTMQLPGPNTSHPGIVTSTSVDSALRRSGSENGDVGVLGVLSSRLLKSFFARLPGSLEVANVSLTLFMERLDSEFLERNERLDRERAREGTRARTT